MHHLLHAFLPKQHLIVVWLNRAMIALCQGFCCVKDIRIYIVIWIINNNVATEMTCLQENMIALKNLGPSENLAPTCPFENSVPLDSKAPLSFCNPAPKAIFFSPPFFARGCILCLIFSHLLLKCSKKFAMI